MKSHNPVISGKFRSNKWTTWRAIRHLPILAWALFGNHSECRAETFTLEEATISQIQKAMSDGALTSVELTTMYLNRISIYDQNGIRLRSIARLNTKALSDAAEVDQKISKGLKFTELTGVPVAVKANHNFASEVTTSGNSEWASIFTETPLTDSYETENFRKSNAIIVCASNLDDFAYGGEGRSSLYGNVQNPYAPGTTVSPGGSSAGSAVALSANFVALANGTDDGGSNRIPAQFSNVVGLKTSYGLISRAGVFSTTPILDHHGPLARTVSDLAPYLNVMAGYDPADPTTSQSNGKVSADYRSSLDAKSLSGKKFAVVPALLFDGDSLTPGVKAAFEQAKDDLRSAGAMVVDVDFPLLTREGHRVRVYDQDGDGVPDFDYYLNSVANGLWQYFQLNYSQSTESLFQKAYSISTIASYLEQPDYAAAFEVAQTKWESNPDIEAFFDRRKQITDEMEAYMTSNEIDAFIWPTLPFEAVRSDDSFGNSPLPTANRLGLPEVSVPAGGFQDDGVPGMNLSFVGSPFSEFELLGYAYAFEVATKYRRVPTLTPALPGETIEYSTATPPATRPELAPPTLRVAGKSNVNGQGSKATVVLSGTAVDASGLASLKVYVNGKKVSAKRARNWRATLKLNALDRLTPAGAKTVAVMVVAKDVYGNTSVAHKRVKLPKNA